MENGVEAFRLCVCVSVCVLYMYVVLSTHQNGKFTHAIYHLSLLLLVAAATAATTNNYLFCAG